MWFDPKAALTRIEREAGHPATSATPATSAMENVPEVAEVAAPQPAQRILAALPILLAGRPDHEITAAGKAVMAFLDNHLEASRCIGWSDLELFGCHPDREAARNRYDYAGAVTLAAMSGKSIERITELAAHYENGLVYYRKRLMPADAVPVWELGKTHCVVQSGQVGELTPMPMPSVSAASLTGPSRQGPWRTGERRLGWGRVPRCRRTTPKSRTIM